MSEWVLVKAHKESPRLFDRRAWSSLRGPWSAQQIFLFARRDNSKDFTCCRSPAQVAGRVVPALIELLANHQVDSK